MRNNAETLERKVRDWNRRHVVGAPIRYHRIIGEGEGMATKTRSEAWVLSGHTAVVMVEGVSGCVALEALSTLSVFRRPAAGGNEAHALPDLRAMQGAPT